MSERCYKCLRPTKPINLCLCHFITPPLDCRIKFVFLMHPKEAKRNRTGTGFLSHAALLDSEILIGLDFSQNAWLQKLLCDAQYIPMLLYPTKDALRANTFFSNTKAHTANNAINKTPLVIVIDATWFCAKKVLEHSPFLLDLPKISFAKNYRSLYTFKKEPSPEYVSTIEACYYLIKEFQEAKIISKEINAEPLMNVFKEMVKRQLQAENDRIEGLLPNTHSYNWKYQKKREIPKELLTAGE